MAVAIAMFVFGSAGILISTAFDLKIRIKRVGISVYWLFPLVAAIVVLATGTLDIQNFGASLIKDSALNPVKILVLFLSMTSMSVMLDELGFFRALALRAARHAGGSQLKFFFILYFTVAVLTAFTSNDVIVLTFTPFLCYFAKNCDVNPIPYIFSEFVAANSWSMIFIIGNPTNIYLAGSYGIDFGTYFTQMALPTLFGCVVSLAVLTALFYKQLKKPMNVSFRGTAEFDKPAVAAGAGILGLTTILLAVSSYINVEMWLISVCGAALMLITELAMSLARRKNKAVFAAVFKRMPWAFVPFLLSMFALTLALSAHGITEKIAAFLSSDYPEFVFGGASSLAAAFINNIPMTVFFTDLIAYLPAEQLTGALYASVIGSNLGTLFTPIGSLAAIMWGRILKEQNVKFGFLRFSAYGTAVGLPALAAALGGLSLMLWIL